MKWSSFAIWSALAGVGVAQDDWEQRPFRYSETIPADPGAKLGEGLEGKSPLERVRTVLERLDIPESSQILVFSKTSKQNDLIGPANPRALYFSENAYAAFVPGGQMEIVTPDASLGPIFRTIHLYDAAPVAVRETGECLVCHGTARTAGVPGVLMRSIFPDDSGLPLLAHGGFAVDSTTPISQRWGGFYVTGTSSLPHLGNRFYRADESPPDFTSPLNLKSLVGRVDTSKYPRATSDIVALLVLEHQCQVNNLITAAAYRYRRATWLAKTLDPAADPDRGTAGRIADDQAEELVAALLFKDAAPLGDGVEGDRSFQDDFEKRFPKTAAGRSLGRFQLGGKLFKYRCSYMIYSHAFEALPPRVKSATIARLREILEGPQKISGYDYLGKSEKRRIVEILKETWPPYR